MENKNTAFNSIVNEEFGVTKREYAVIQMLSARCGSFDFIPDRETVQDIIKLADVLFEELENKSLQ